MATKQLVHDVLYEAACGFGPKAHAAEAELRHRGHHLSAEAARLKREFLIRDMHMTGVREPVKFALTNTIA